MGGSGVQSLSLEAGNQDKILEPTLLFTLPCLRSWDSVVLQNTPYTKKMTGPVDCDCSSETACHAG